MTADPEKDLNQTPGPDATQAVHKKDVGASLGSAQGTEAPDPYVVDWDGPDDPHNPFNWTTFKKFRQLVGMAFNTFLT